MSYRDFEVRSKEDFDDEEIQGIFFQLYDMAREYYDNKVDETRTEDEYYDFEDQKHYIFENVMEILGDDVWRVLNRHG